MKELFKNPYLQTACLFAAVVTVLGWVDPTVAGKLDDAFKPITTAKGDIMSVLTNVVGPAVVVLGVASGAILMVAKREWLKFSGFAVLSGIGLSVAEKIGEWVKTLTTSS